MTMTMPLAVTTEAVIYPNTHKKGLDYKVRWIVDIIYQCRRYLIVRNESAERFFEFETLLTLSKIAKYLLADYKG